MEGFDTSESDKALNKIIGYTLPCEINIIWLILYGKSLIDFSILLPVQIVIWILAVLKEAIGD